METSEQIKGLTKTEIEESRRLHGRNILSPSKHEKTWKQFLRKFTDPLIVILLVAGILSVGIAAYEYISLGKGAEVFFEPSGIFIAILLATGLAFVFEQKAEKEFEQLNKVSDEDPVEVIRDYNVTTVPRHDVVVGDIVRLTTGCEVPADGILIESTDLSADESTLTGEPVTAKNADSSKADPDATFPSNHLYRGTKIMEGHGIMKTTAVGDSTEAGRVVTAVNTAGKNIVTPLDEQLTRLSTVIARIAYIASGAIIIGRTILFFASGQEMDWTHAATYFLQSFMIAVALIAVSVPEGLPMAVTISLALSMRRMIKTNNLVRRLHACETMGATTVICTDKTGTLTQNRMQVSEIHTFTNNSTDLLYENIAVNSTASLDRSSATPKAVGNPTEGALLLYLNSIGTDYNELRDKVKVIAELPFSTERKYMATEVISAARPGVRMIYVKGAPEIVMAMCKPVDSEESDPSALLLDYQTKAMRTLAFACKELPATAPSPIADRRGEINLSDLKLIAVAAISDPVRADVPEAVDTVRNAGIDIKIVTGDTPATATEIGRQIGLIDSDTDVSQAVITGNELAALPDEALRRRVKELKVIARARPLDKQRLVEALQANGEIVAVTGDGTNDAPALRAAHVGLSMGDGTAVAKEASDITIIDNSFASIGRAVMWGRSLYINIQRFILFQMTVNVVATLVVVAGAFLSQQSPLSVTQMLWVNLIMDTFAAMALSSLPPSQDVMKDAPRSRKAFIITPSMWSFIIGVGIVMFTALVIFLWMIEHYDIAGLSPEPSTTLTPHELTVFFTVFVMLQFWNMFNARAFATHRSAFHLSECRGFLIISGIILLGQIVIVELGGQFFNVVPLSLRDWVTIVAITSPVLLIGEAIRLFNSRKSRKRINQPH